jgi:Calcineurin-like phosphoesterase
MADKIEEYLKDNFQYISEEKQKVNFTWKKIIEDIQKITGKAITSDGVRKRFSRLAHLKNTDSTFPPHSSYSFVEDLDKQEAKLTTVVDSKLTEEEIYTKYSMNKTKYRISQIWYKDKASGGYIMSVNFVNNTKDSIDYKVEFDKFIDDYNKSIFDKTCNYNFKEETELPVLLEIVLSDLHFGKHADSTYSAKLIQNIKKIIDSYSLEDGIEEILFLNTGDLLNSDNYRNQTTNLTNVESQEDWESAIQKAYDFTTQIIDFASKFGKKVTFVNIRGNHDYNASYVLGEGLKKIYEKQDRITILNSKNSTIYYEFRKNAFMFSHGDKNADRLPLTFATEFEGFSKCKFRHIHTGHTHTGQIKKFLNVMQESNGIEHRVFGSPTKTDRWHKDFNFVGNKTQLTACLFNESDGKFAEININI